MSALVCDRCGVEITATKSDAVLISELSTYRKALWEIKNDLLSLPADPRLTSLISKITEVLRG